MNHDYKQMQAVDPRIVSRSTVPPGKRYPAYRQELRRDFFYSCAYCTMTEFEGQSISMEIDHYEPRNARKDLENDYSNLMYACRVCNERKGDRYPPPEARQDGHQFFRADQQARSEHFQLEDLKVASKSNTGEFTIRMLDLNREALQKIRGIRERMTKCLPLIADGVFGLRNYPVDNLPPYIRARTFATVKKITDMAIGLESQTDEALLAFAKSELIDPDEGSPDRTKAREEYMKGLNALYPGKPFRGRGKK